MSQTISPKAVTLESSTQENPLGTRHETVANGKVYYYCQANEALTAGAILTPVNLFDGDCDASSGAVLNDAAVTFTAATVGAYVIINAGTNSITDAPNRVLSYTANALVLENEWSADLTTSEDYVIYKPYLMEMCDAAGEKVFGVTPAAGVTSGNYFWMQVKGYCDKCLVIGSTDPIVQHEGLVSSSTEGTAKGMTAAGTTTDEADKSCMHAVVPTALQQPIPIVLNC